MKPKTTKQYRDERTVLSRIVNALLEAGYEIRVDDRMDVSEPLTTAKQVIEYVTWDDKERGRHLWNLEDFYIRAERSTGMSSVWFIMDNGEPDECVCDYGMSLDPIIQPILDACKS